MKTLRSAMVFYREFGLFLTVKRILEVLADKVILLVAVSTSFGLILQLFYLKMCIKSSGNFPTLLQIAQGKRDKLPLVGLLYVGGMGDSLILSSLAVAVIKKYPKAKIFAFVRDQSHFELFRGSELISAVYAVLPKRLDLLRHCMEQIFDIFMEDRYVIRIKNDLATNEERARTERTFRELDRNWETFPLGNHIFGDMGLTLFELASRCTDLAVIEDDLTIPLLSNDFDRLPDLLPGIAPFKYITVHHGSDSKMILPDGSGTILQSKNWYTERWEELVEQLSLLGYPTIQLGLDGEIRINHAINMLGKLSIRETASVLKYAALHLDTEGGLVHLARGVNTRSVVIFGPTPVSLYGYRENIKIAEGECKNCFWTDVRWFQRCPKGNPIPICMDAVSSQKVIEATITTLQTNKHRSLPKAELIDLSLFDTSLTERLADTLLDIYKSADINFKGVSVSSHNKQTGCYVHASKNWEYLYVMDNIKDSHPSLKIADVGAGRGALQVSLSAHDWVVYSVDLGFSEHSHDGNDCRHSFLEAYGTRINFRFASIFNLPFPDDSFDVIVSVSVIEHLRNKEYALYELLRVLKPGGKLVLTFDITSHNNLSVTADDSNRIEIFTPESIAGCLASIGVDIKPPDIDYSLAQMQKSNIEGIPAGMTVGGITLHKIDENINKSVKYLILPQTG